MDIEARLALPESASWRSFLRAGAARRLAVEMLHGGGEGHYGGSLSIIDILAVLFEGFLKPGHDRFILSKGHGAPGYYSVLAQRGLIPAEKLAQYGRAGAALQGHPDMTAEKAIDFSTGSLGQGLSVGLGMAVALRGTGARVWVLLGDGECQEGQVWEAAMLADRLNASNLTAIIDANGHQEWGFRHEGRAEAPLKDGAAKWSAFGWHATEVDGHEHDALWGALETARQRQNGPSVVIARTHKGFGSPVFEQDPDRFHCGALSDEEYQTVLADLR